MNLTIQRRTTLLLWPVFMMSFAPISNAKPSPKNQTVEGLLAAELSEEKFPGRFGAEGPSSGAQDSAGLVQLRNKSSLKVTAKLVGPTPKVVQLDGLGIYTLRVTPGYYFFVYQFHNSDGRNYFFKTSSFNVKGGPDKMIAIPAIAGPENCILTCLESITESTENEFAAPRGWPTEGVKTEANPHFSALKLIVLIQDLYDAPDEYQYRLNAVVAIKPVLTRGVGQSVVLPLRQQGFRLTYSGISSARTLPERYPEPTLVVTYNESEGQKFRGPRGVNITCRLALYGAGSPNSEPMWEKYLEATNDFEVKIDLLDATQSFRKNSLKELKTKFDQLFLDLTEWKAGK